MKSIWELGEWSGQRGKDLAIHSIRCPFCSEVGDFSFEHKASKKRTDQKELHFDTLKCGNCAGYALAFWSASRNGLLHDAVIFPAPSLVSSAPAEWPSDVGQNWVEAHRSLSVDNWNSAATMARSSLQAAMRQQGAKGKDLKTEIDDLASQGILPPVMKDWSTDIRELGNNAAHPKPGHAPPTERDARDIVRFLDYLFEYLYTFPHQIREYRARKP